MLLDLAKSAAPARLEADVVIIGAGAAGIVLALELSESGLAVLLVEAGGEKFEAASQEFYRAEVIEPESHGPVHMFRRRVLGGSTSVWGGRCIPFDPIDFETRPWISYGRWPITYDDVAVHYAKALDYADAGPAIFDAAAAIPGEPGPMVGGVTSPDVVLDRIERFSHPLHFGAQYKSRLAADLGIRVLLNAPVEQILTAHDGNVAAGVRIVTPSGKRLILHAPRVIIAAGGLETARLLLASREARSAGLGNEHDLVGRFYQCHFEGELGEVRFIKPIDSVRMDYQRSVEGVYCRRYIWLSPEAQRAKQLAGLVIRPNHPNIVDPEHRNPVLSAMYLVKSQIVPEYARKLTSLEDQKRLERGESVAAFWGRHLRNMILGSPELLAFSADFARRRTFAKRKLPSVVLKDSRNVYPLDINAEQEPNRESRITLGDERDQHGVPRLLIDWRTTSADHHRLAEGLKTVQAAFASSATSSLHFTSAEFELALNRKIPVGGHHIGTARMAESAAEGVCDGNCELFSTRGVYIAGAAAFSTSGFANPTLTLIALALRLAQHIAKQP